MARAYPERLVDAEIGKVKFSHNKTFINIEQSKSAGIPLMLNLIITLIVTFMVTLMVALMVILMVAIDQRNLKWKHIVPVCR